jgi:beta-glucanase (GH16 family)
VDTGMTTESQRLRTAAQKIADALNQAEGQGFRIVVDEDGDGGVTVWSADGEDFAEAMRVTGGPGWEARE